MIDWREGYVDEWADKCPGLAKAGDIASVIQTIERDETGIDYAVDVILRSLAATACSYAGEGDRMVVWSRRVPFGMTDATVAGGSAFVHTAREQERVAEEIAAMVRRS